VNGFCKSISPLGRWQSRSYRWRRPSSQASHAPCRGSLNLNNRNANTNATADRGASQSRARPTAEPQINATFAPAEAIRNFDKCASAQGSGARGPHAWCLATRDPPQPQRRVPGLVFCFHQPPSEAMIWHGEASVWNYFAALEYRFASFSGVHSSTISIGLMANNSNPALSS
jgi:hypothetical protein